ncbi:HAMP domain-containing sensor histidine kinase [Kiloniella laminariae]|uniref:histidine kinase n=1 Tax=Kiloniella laminariae TaxID=454162 RepID=A0ABT4LQ15_9PROT|nr:HAMP domain-containing sensor histidine kinase [Kiloniella laminariae]MCZ4282990.1 HAMP domain-containing sensor histidine kinase [Kiloniella laminariae]
MNEITFNKPKTFWNVGRKVCLIAVSGTSLLFAILTYVNWYLEKQHITEIWVENSMVKTERLASQISDVVRREQADEIWTSFNFLTPREQVVAFDLRVYNPEGKKLVEHLGLDRKNDDQRFSEILTGKTLNTDYFIDDVGIAVATPIRTRHSESYGTLVVTWSLSSRNTFLRDTIKTQLYLFLGFTVISCFFLFTLINRTIASHLTQLSHDMVLIVKNQCSKGSKLLNRNDEFGVIALSLEVFKRHMDELQNTKTALEDKTRLLEITLEKEQMQNSMQRDFVSMASHEIRTPLTIIDSSVQRIRRRLDALDKDFVDSKLNKISGATQRMLELLDSTLSTSRIEAGEVDISLAPLDLAGLVALTCINHQDYSEHHHIIYDVRALPRNIVADRRKLVQVITNLLSNAIKYSPGAEQIIIGSYIENGRAYISFQDFGIGISQEDWPKIFGRYFRSSNTSGISGTGIGLCLVQWLLELHGGSISVESELEVGSTFTIMLPIKDAGEEQAEIIDVPLISSEADFSGADKIAVARS